MSEFHTYRLVVKSHKKSESESETDRCMKYIAKRTKSAAVSPLASATNRSCAARVGSGMKTIWAVLTVLLLLFLQPVLAALAGGSYSNSAAAQPAIAMVQAVATAADTSAVEMQSLTRKETASLEQQYDRLINESMAVYFDPSTFIVNSRLRIEMVEQRFSERSLDQTQIRSTGQTLPGLNALPDFLRQMQQDPGIARERTVTQLVPDIQQVFIEIVVDESFTEEQREFMAYLARSVSKLDETRGDTLTITDMAFPERTRADIAAGVDNAAAPALPAQTATTEPQGQAVAQAAQEGVPLMESLKDNVYLWAGLAGLLLLVIALIFYAFKLNRRLKNEDAYTASRASAGSGSRLPSAAASNGAAPAGNGQAGGQITKETTRERIKESVFSGFAKEDMQPHELLYNYFMNFPGDMGRLLDMWISKDGEEGLDKAARLVAVADKRLVTKLQPTLDENHAEWLTDRVLDIANEYNDKPGEDPDIAKTVRDVTGTLKLRERKNCADFRLRTLKHFDFLEYTPIDVLVTLLSDKDGDSIALVVSHLTEERADELIYKLPESKLVHVWAQMQFVNLIKYKKYVSQADEIYISLMNHEKYRIENELIDHEMVDRICTQIESRDTITQNKIYHQITQIDTEMAKKIQARVITLANLGDIDITVLQRAAEQMKAEPLALAIAGLDKALTNNIFDERSEREKNFLMSIMNKSKSYDAKQIEESRQQFLQTVRQIDTEDSKNIQYKINDL